MPVDGVTSDDVAVSGNGVLPAVPVQGLPDVKESSFLSSDGSLSIHAGIYKNTFIIIIIIFILKLESFLSFLLKNY